MTPTETLKIDFPLVQRQVFLAIAVKAMNDTLGPEGTVPSALIFGEFPSLFSFTSILVPRPTLTERAQVALKRRDMWLIIWRKPKHSEH